MFKESFKSILFIVCILCMMGFAVLLGLGLVVPMWASFIFGVAIVLMAFSSIPHIHEFIYG